MCEAAPRQLAPLLLQPLAPGALHTPTVLAVPLALLAAAVVRGGYRPGGVWAAGWSPLSALEPGTNEFGMPYRAIGYARGAAVGPRELPETPVNPTDSRFRWASSHALSALAKRARGVYHWESLGSEGSVRRRCSLLLTARFLVRIQVGELATNPVGPSL